MVIRLGQRSPTGQWRQRLIDADCPWTIHLQIDRIMFASVQTPVYVILINYVFEFSHDNDLCSSTIVLYVWRPNFRLPSWSPFIFVKSLQLIWMSVAYGWTLYVGLLISRCLIISIGFTVIKTSRSQDDLITGFPIPAKMTFLLNRGPSHRKCWVIWYAIAIVCLCV